MSNERILNKKFLAKLIALLEVQRTTSIKWAERKSKLEDALAITGMFIALMREDLPTQEKEILSSIFTGIENLIYRSMQGTVADFSQAIAALHFLHSCIKE